MHATRSRECDEPWATNATTELCGEADSPSGGNVIVVDLLLTMSRNFYRSPQVFQRDHCLFATLTERAAS